MPVLESAETNVLVPEKKTYPISRCFKGKVLQSASEEDGILTGEAAYQLLKTTHEDFNHIVRRTIQAIEEGRRSQNPRLQSLLNWMLEKPANSAHNVLEPLTIPGLKTDRKSYPPEQVENLSSLAEGGFLLIDIQTEYPWLRTALRRKIFQKSVEKIKAYEELMQLWREGQSKSKAKPASLIENPETTYKKLAKILKDFSEDLAEKRDNDAWLDAFLKGLEENKGKKGPVWFRNFYHQSIENPIYIGAFIDEYSSDVLGKEEWKKRKKQWEKEKDNPKFLEAYETFFKPLEDNRIGLHQLIMDWGVEGRLSSSLQAAYHQKGIEGVLEALGQKRFGESIQGGGYTFRPNYRRSQRALLAVRAFGEYLCRWKNPDTAYYDISLVQIEQESEQIEAASLQDYWQQLEDQNPEIRELLKILQLYNQRFKKFRRPPGKRLPDPESHPEWLDFQKDSGYKNLNFATKTVQLMVAANHDQQDESRYQWRTFRFGVDRRFENLLSVRVVKTGKTDATTGEVKVKEADLYQWKDPKTGELSHVDIKGIKLLVRNKRAELVFRYEYEKDLFSKIKFDGQTLPGTRVLSFDLGQKFLAAITAYERFGMDATEVKSIPFKPHYLSDRKRHSSKPVSAYIFEVPGLSFKAIHQVERELSAKTRKMTQSDKPKGEGKARFIVRGTRNHVGLRNHLRRIKDERVKKAANAILRTALNLKDAEDRRIVIVHEDLTSYKASLKRERFENNRLQRWSVQNLLNYLEAMAEPYGIMVVGVSPAYTSQVCSQCGYWGFRFDIPSEKGWARWVRRNRKVEAREKGIDWTQMTRDISVKEQYRLLKEKGMPRKAIIVSGGDFFCCSNPACTGLPAERQNRPEYRYTVNADVNAARNLARKFHGGINLIANKPDDEQRDVLKAQIQQYLEQYYTPRVIHS